ncbi:hypothetical protein BOSEA31B_11263 [Hyphomicrobiales bacterium]|nr:hypothetical protein BOSEA31B_11263 [Hyphomicrobiales bacterium]CAH1697055.1 hypothetical protein BOSEA1005_10092 [Hyphomicrobiales bacterium]CAI0344993.1 hypothetical protein BO1005MUT1_350360 [Hyphomicrobiales bacterium]
MRHHSFIQRRSQPPRKGGFLLGLIGLDAVGVQGRSLTAVSIVGLSVGLANKANKGEANRCRCPMSQSAPRSPPLQ